MDKLSNLKPELVWKYFENITKVPRPSKKEEKIIQFLFDFAVKHQLEVKSDDAGNILIKKPAYKGYENHKTVVLQSHLDMVCEKNKGVEIDFDNDPIQPYIDGNWVKAKGTTLGADDGIGVAAEMALLASSDIPHPPLECLFTVDEETGLTGAFQMKEGFFDGKILINLDSEDEGEIFIGCAGGINTIAEFEIKKKDVPSDSKAFKIDIEGLKGGHSGDEIHKGFGNAVKLINRFLLKASKNHKIKLHKIEAGSKHNAIPREGYAIFTVKSERANKIEKAYKEYAEEIKREIGVREPNMHFSIEETKLPKYVLSKNLQKSLIYAIYANPHGVHAWSPDIDDFVETSNNLAYVQVINDKKIKVLNSERSSLESGKDDIAQKVASVYELANADVSFTEGYPGWAPDPDSEILKISEDSYKRLFNKKPVVRAIHAGLECGLFLKKYPYLDMISIGPELVDVHTPEEKIDIKTVEMWWDHLLDILKNIPEE